MDGALVFARKRISFVFKCLLEVMFFTISYTFEKYFVFTVITFITLHLHGECLKLSPKKRGEPLSTTK